MKIAQLFKNTTIKQANIFTLIVIFIFSIIFVSLLVEDMYKDYEKTLEQNIHKTSTTIVDTKLIEQKNKTLKSLLIKAILTIVTLSFILFAIMLAIYKIFHTLLQRDIQTFLNFFQSAAKSDKIINPKSVFFKDFKIMVGHANKMVITINEQKATLKELNLSLEDKVKSKTAKLLEEKKFSEDILNAQKEFLRYTVHETNTPLSVILTSLELYTMNNKKDRQLLKIEAATKNIFNIYDDLSYLVKKDQVDYPKAPIELNSFISSRVEFFRDVANLSKIEFVYIPHAENTYVYINETKLQRIVDNTITNAIKYTQANEIVNIDINQKGLNADFSVASKSKIIKNTNKIFDAYYRETKSVKGFGIGLQLVKNICEQEGIFIFIDSTEELTKFTYRFKIMGE